MGGVIRSEGISGTALHSAPVQRKARRSEKSSLSLKPHSLILSILSHAQNEDWAPERQGYPEESTAASPSRKWRPV